MKIHSILDFFSSSPIKQQPEPIVHLGVTHFHRHASCFPCVAFLANSLYSPSVLCPRSVTSIHLNILVIALHTCTNKHLFELCTFCTKSWHPATGRRLVYAYLCH
jgi:hypothetical protein